MMQLEIISPNGLLLKKAVSLVRLPGVEGPFTLLEGHAPLIAALTKGVIEYEAESGELKNLEIRSGFVEVVDDEIKVCAD